jgi:hypothetical protein
MRLLARDLRKLELYKPLATKNPDGEIISVYDAPPVLSFAGNAQPFSNRENPQEYGLDPKYAYVIYTYPNAAFAETDRVKFGERWLEIALIQRWSDYYRLLAKEATRDG